MDPENPNDPTTVKELTVGDEETVPTEPKTPSLLLEKEVTSKPADGKAYKTGEKISYKLLVTNDGNVTLENIEVTDAGRYDAAVWRSPCRTAQKAQGEPKPLIGK